MAVGSHDSDQEESEGRSRFGDAEEAAFD